MTENSGEAFVTSLNPKMPSINNKESSKVPEGFPPVIDTHVHIFPRGISCMNVWAG
jgi:hypothetical protein